ncbi:MAG: aminopeptidase P family protein [Firmicutes bacterium]|nr:aminopeptidase P family protein [Candidatus Fermentithermobacillaceae bacterium]
MDFVRRVSELRKKMQAEGLHAIVYGTGANFQYLTGLPVPWRRLEEPREPSDFLVVSEAHEPLVILSRASSHLATGAPFPQVICDSPSEAVKMIRRHIRGNRGGLSRQSYAYLADLIKQAVPEAECREAEHLGEDLRMIKNPQEVKLLRKAADLVGMTLRELVPHIRPGVRQGDLRRMIADIGKSLGADDVSFPPGPLFVKSGTPPTEDPFVYPEAEGLVPGTSVAFDFGFIVEGYCSDFGRSFYCGPSPRDFKKAYRALHTALIDLVNGIRPNETRIGDLFGMLEAVMDSLGYGDRLRARHTDRTLGHLIGLDVHELPWIRPDAHILVRPGMVMALEPKVWLPGEYYLRVEDIVLITDTGAEFLTEFDRELFELPV